MSQLTLLFRYCRLTKNFNSVSVNSRNIFTSSSLCDEDNENKNDEVEKEIKKDETQKKLNDLLKVMMNSKSVPNITIPKPRALAQKKAFEEKSVREREAEAFEKRKLGHRLAEAASKVASTLGGDTEKTEMELLDIYFKRQLPNTNPSEEGTKKPVPNVKDLLNTMKIEKPVPDENTRSFQVKMLTKTSGQRKIPAMALSKKRAGVTEKVNILDSTPLNIFSTEETPDTERPTPAFCYVWEYLEQREQRLSVTHPPNNIFEQLILWTEQGKIWKFPIDNEQDWKEEENVDFTEHVFLEHLLEPWCPQTGPIRTFMELVCVGLSKNPHLRVADKYAHIFYYEHYFRGKNNILEELNLETIKDREPDQLEKSAIA